MSHPVLFRLCCSMFCKADLNDRIVRLGSWRDVITVSGEWRSEQYSSDVVEQYFDGVLILMLLLLGEELEV